MAPVVVAPEGRRGQDRTVPALPSEGTVGMNDEKISYAGVAGAVGAIVALLGIYAGWYRFDVPVDLTLDATVYWAGDLALWASIATFAFACSFILFSDPGIRRAMGALMTLSSVVLVFAVVFGFVQVQTALTQAVDRGAVPADAGAVGGRALGLYLSALGAVLAIAGGIRTLGADVVRAGASSAGDTSDATATSGEGRAGAEPAERAAGAEGAGEDVR
jgi:hypothetical protein